MRVEGKLDMRLTISGRFVLDFPLGLSESFVGRYIGAISDLGITCNEHAL